MNRPEVLALLVCDAGEVDEQGKVSLHGLFDAVWTTRVPARHPALAIFFKCHAPRSSAVRVVVEAADGTPVVSSEPIALEGPGLAQLLHTLVDIEFPQAGEYRVRVVDAEGAIASTALEVRVRQ